MTVSRRDIASAGAAVAFAAASAGLAAGQERNTALAPPIVPGVTLASAPIELAGNWGRMIPRSADTVVEYMRHACLDGVRLVSDRQPTRLRVDEHGSGPPSVWLHDDGSTTAWVIVDIGQQAWSQLAYQFGHELGHVLANSWQAHDKPGGPCQWLEEALVEAFSLRGLDKAAARWKQNPPFANDNAYGEEIRRYREAVVQQYASLGAQQGGLDDLGGWYGRHRSSIEGGGGLNDFAKAAAILILAAYETNPGCVEALGALNRWPGRARLGLADYLRRWRASCAELGASADLPARLVRELRVNPAP